MAFKPLVPKCALNVATQCNSTRKKNFYNSDALTLDLIIHSQFHQHVVIDTIGRPIMPVIVGRD